MSLPRLGHDSFNDGTLEAYRADVRAGRLSLLDSARAFALEPWHYDHEDHRCLHDAWIVGSTLRAGVRERDAAEVSLTLLLPYHDFQLDLRYGGVSDLQISYTGWPFGDILVDEFVSTGSGRCAHVFHLARGEDRCEVSFETFSYEVTPVAPTS